MLFPYTYVPHQIEKMQGFIDFIFREVWCHAVPEEYGIHLFRGNEALHGLMEELYRKDCAGILGKGTAGAFFYESINKIYNEFALLTEEERAEYWRYYNANNDIEKACDGDSACRPVTYADLDTAKSALNDELKNFFKVIYSSGFLELSKTREVIGSLGDYYREFTQTNNEGVCPFCGLLPMDGEYDPTREAFDHYLPKSKYPFNSLNMRNLAPACGKCNSDNKKAQDPLHGKSGERRKAFYPFARKHKEIEIKIRIIKKEWLNLTPEDLQFSYSPVATREKIDTWRELYGIDERYSARCCGKGGGRAWLARVFDECKNYNYSPRQMVSAEIKSAVDQPWVEVNFLKKAFLEGCRKAGLFSDEEGRSFICRLLRTAWTKCLGRT